MTLAATEIRPIEDGDSFDLIGLIAACWAEYPNCVFALDEVPHLAAPAGAYRAWGGASWVALAPGGRLVGSVGIAPAPGGGAELKQLYVHRDARGSGLGSRLAGMAEEHARTEIGAGWIHLWSDTRFLDAHRLYLRLGYEQQSETRELFDRSDTVEYEFRKTL